MTADEASLKSRLLGAALELLEAEGAAPSLRAVARAVGVSAMAPYSYFNDKTALMCAVADCGFEAMAAKLEEADRHHDAAEALVAQGMAFVAFAQSNPALFRLIYSHEYGHAHTELVRRTYRILEARVEQIIPSHVAAGTLACRSLVQGMATIALNGRLAPAADQDVEMAIRLLVGGLAAMGAAADRSPTPPPPPST